MKKSYYRHISWTLYSFFSFINHHCSNLKVDLTKQYCREHRYIIMDELRTPFSPIFTIVHDKISVLVKVYLPVTSTIFTKSFFQILVTITLQEESCLLFIKLEILQGQREEWLLSKDELAAQNLERSELKNFRKSAPI